MNLKDSLVAEVQHQVPGLGRLSAMQLAGRILQLADRFFPPRRSLHPGQLTWPAIRLSDGPGRRIEHTTFHPVTLDLALAEPWVGARRRQERSRVAAALFQQARDQGALLSTADVGTILCTSPRSVASHVQAYQRSSAKVIPTRATVHDIGPGITHRLIICEKLMVEGRSVEQTASDTHHSVRAVTRYLKGFTRVRFCLQAGMSTEQTAYLTRMSIDLVNKYRALHASLANSAPSEASLDGRQPGGVQ